MANRERFEDQGRDQYQPRGRNEERGGNEERRSAESWTPSAQPWGGSQGGYGMRRGWQNRDAQQSGWERYHSQTQGPSWSQDQQWNQSRGLGQNYGQSSYNQFSDDQSWNQGSGLYGNHNTDSQGSPDFRNSRDGGFRNSYGPGMGGGYSQNMGYGSSASPGGFGNAGYNSDLDWDRFGRSGNRQGWSQTDERRNVAAQHSGKGPKGYSRSDDRIKEEVCDALMDHPGIDATEIEVKVTAGEVTLSGIVEERYAKRMAEDIAERVRGVRDVTNQLRIQSGRDHERNDRASHAGASGAGTSTASSGLSGDRQNQTSTGTANRTDGSTASGTTGMAGMKKSGDEHRSAVQ